MPSPYSTRRNELCRHEDLRPECRSCRQESFKFEVEEAAELEERLPEIVATLEEEILSERDPDQRAKLEADKERRIAEVQTFVHDVNEGLELITKQVKAICADNEPDMLSQAFEDDAVSRELRAAQIWRENAISEEQRAYPRFKDETPAREMSFKGLDLTKVPALPDYLLKDPVGLKSFLRSARNIPDAHPMKAVGKSGGPAVMSLGAAIAMFGVPKLGADWPSESTSGQATEETTPLTEAPVPGVTELDMKKSSYGGKALVASVFESDAEQWALFGHTKHLKFVDMLAAHYVRLVAAKEEHVKTVAAKVRAKAAIAKRQVVADQTGKRSEKAAAEPSATTDEALPAIFGGWPDVQELDWISFTNWVQACRRLDKNFGKTALPKWEQERLERFALAKVLDKWDLSAAIANGFDDGCSGSKPPTAYYDKAKTIMEIDAPKAGIDPKTGKARVARRGR